MFLYTYKYCNVFFSGIWMEQLGDKGVHSAVWGRLKQTWLLCPTRVDWPFIKPRGHTVQIIFSVIFVSPSLVSEKILSNWERDKVIDPFVIYCNNSEHCVSYCIHNTQINSWSDFLSTKKNVPPFNSELVTCSTFYSQHIGCNQE